jgi:hypothetical protein
MIRFREVQRPAWWAYAAIAPAAVALAGAFAWRFALGRPLGDGSLPDWALALIVALGAVAIPLVTAFMRLVVEVEAPVLRIRLWPFPARTIPLSEIAEAKAETYRPLREFGGWGLRFARGGKRAYSMRGNRGVRLRLRDGRVVMVGSQRAEELEAALAPSRE